MLKSVTTQNEISSMRLGTKLKCFYPMVFLLIKDGLLLKIFTVNNKKFKAGHKMMWNVLC